MFNLYFVPLQANLHAKLIIYDENTAIKCVNNCYRHGFFACESAFSQKWHLLIAAYPRQSGHEGTRHTLRPGPGPRNAYQEQIRRQ